MVALKKFNAYKKLFLAKTYKTLFFSDLHKGEFMSSKVIICGVNTSTLPHLTEKITLFIDNLNLFLIKNPTYASRGFKQTKKSKN
jgi:hypothetical protein